MAVCAVISRTGNNTCVLICRIFHNAFEEHVIRSVSTIKTATTHEPVSASKSRVGILKIQSTRRKGKKNRTASFLQMKIIRVDLTIWFYKQVKDKKSRIFVALPCSLTCLVAFLMQSFPFVSASNAQTAPRSCSPWACVVMEMSPSGKKNKRKRKQVWDTVTISDMCVKGGRTVTPTFI